MKSAYDAVVVGSGPNGLAAAITMAEAGRSVLLLEAHAEIGGGLRSAPLTLPGRIHDVCSAVHPLGIASPFFRRLALERYGLEWIHPEIPAAHPLDDGTAVALRRSLEATANDVGPDGSAYQNLMRPFVEAWEPLAQEVLTPTVHLPRHPMLLGRFGMRAIRSADGLARSLFDGQRARSLFAGLAAHAMVPLDGWASASTGMILGVMAHAVGWPLPKGGAARLAEAMTRHLESLGGEIRTGVRVTSLDELPTTRSVLLDVTPLQLLSLSGDRLPGRYRRRLEAFRYGAAAFKVDGLLSGPIPWKANVCRSAGTVHLGGTADEILAAEEDVDRGRHPEKPYVLLVQPTRVDPTRAPDGEEILWAYCHVPQGSDVDMTDRVLAQIERFAPGFRDRVLEIVVRAPADLEKENPNLIGGSISGGTMDLQQILSRPTFGPYPYRTPLPGVYLCSSSTPPGPGVHGMCGFHAAQCALADLVRGRV